MTHQKGGSCYRELDRLEEWSSKSSMTFSRQGQGPAYNQRAQHRTGFIQLGCSCTQRDLRFLVDKLTESAVCHCSKGLNPGVNAQGHYEQR